MTRLQLIGLGLFQFVVFCAQAQKKTFPDCDSSSLKQIVFTRAEVMPKVKNSTLSMQDFFKDFFKNVSSKVKVSGRMLIQFFIDKNGNGCCLQIDNNLSIPVNADTLKNLLNDKIKWEPAMQNDRLVPCFKIIYIMFKKGIINISEPL